MMMDEQQYATKIYQLLEHANNPLYLFDDDVDGLCSYLILDHHFDGKGRGRTIKTGPQVSELFVRYIHEQGADVVVILDKAGISEEFIALCPVPIIWIDHHQLAQDIPSTVLYYNPIRFDKPTLPTSYWSYRIVEQPNELLWLAYAGCISDWQVADDLDKKAREQFGELLDTYTHPPDILFDSPFGEVIRIMLMCLKGASSDVKRSIQALKKIKSPHQLLDASDRVGSFLQRRVARINQEYQQLLCVSERSVSEDPLIVFEYDQQTTSLTAHLSNQLLHKYPHKVIVVARRKDDEYRCSLRCSPPLDIRDILEQLIGEVQGYGGGHQQACGACIKQDDFHHFIDQLRHKVVERSQET